MRRIPAYPHTRNMCGTSYDTKSVIRLSAYVPIGMTITPLTRVYTVVWVLRSVIPTVFRIHLIVIRT